MNIDFSSGYVNAGETTAPVNPLLGSQPPDLRAVEVYKEVQFTVRKSINTSHDGKENCVSSAADISLRARRRRNSGLWTKLLGSIDKDNKKYSFFSIMKSSQRSVSSVTQKTLYYPTLPPFPSLITQLSLTLHI